MHVVLLGDSIFDNAVYVGGGPDVVAQLRAILPPGWRASLGAVDGATTYDIGRQLDQLPDDTTHAVLSIGGNDALTYSGLLDIRVHSSAETLTHFADAAATFQQRYRAIVQDRRLQQIPLTVCTVYDGNFPDPAYQRVASAGLSFFNDAILRVAFAAGLTVIDLRLVCDEPEDYANPIEPSVAGGAKIAAAIKRAIALPPTESRVSRIVGAISSFPRP